MEPQTITLQFNSVIEFRRFVLNLNTEAGRDEPQFSVLVNDITLNFEIDVEPEQA